MKGRRALVTGAASGIGLAIVEELVARGAKVLASDFPGPALQEVAARFDVTPIPADLSKREDVDRLALQAGQIDVLINNAGLQHVSPIESFDPLMWDKLIAVMLTAPFLLMRAIVPSMYERHWGRVVNVASVHGLIASPYKSAYVTAKHGVAGFTKTVALEVAELGITVNAVCPGYVLTPLVEQQIPDTARARGISTDEVIRNVLLAAQPTRKFVTVEQVAALTCFLCTDDAASITGAILPIEGGWTAQ